jgi:hypothetical protein
MSPHSIALAWMLLAVAASTHAQDVPQSVHAKLIGALLCEGNPLDTVRTLASPGSGSYNLGHASLTFGEDMDERNVIVLRSPLRVAGAKASGVVLDLAVIYRDFSGSVYAVFEGDYLTVAKQLNLKPPTGKASVIGKYQRRLDLDLDGKPDSTCPKTIALTPLQEKGKFLLGCGWCNG